MNKAAFEVAWQGMSFEERAHVVKLAVEEFCQDSGLPAVTVHVLEAKAAPVLVEGEWKTPTGEAWSKDSDMREVVIYGWSPGLNNPGEVIDNPWESLTAGYHEAIHYYMKEITGNDFSVKELDPIVEDLGVRFMQRMQRDIEQGAQDMGGASRPDGALPPGPPPPTGPEPSPDAWDGDRHTRNPLPPAPDWPSTPEPPGDERPYGPHHLKPVGEDGWQTVSPDPQQHQPPPEAAPNPGQHNPPAGFGHGQ